MMESVSILAKLYPLLWADSLGFHDPSFIHLEPVLKSTALVYEGNLKVIIGCFFESMLLTVKITVKIPSVNSRFLWSVWNFCGIFFYIL